MRSVLVSLPVRNLKVSAAFFGELGFSFRPELSDNDSAWMVVDDNVHIQLLSDERYQDAVNPDAGATGSAGEMMTCLSVDSEQEVDAMIAKAIAVGAKPWPVLEGIPGYRATFQDLDGHLWQLVCQPAVRSSAAEQVDRPSVGRLLVPQLTG